MATKTQLKADLRYPRILRSRTRLAGQFNLYLTLIFTAILAVFIFAPKNSLAASIDEVRLVQLANQERSLNGLNILEINPQLYSAAKAKAQDMFDNNYFEHYSPIGKSPWDFIHASGYVYQMAGENLAIDFARTDSIHFAWMNSPAHKANILKPQYQDIAIAAVEGNFSDHQTTIVVEMFGKPGSKQFAAINDLIFKIHNLILGIENK